MGKCNEHNNTPILLVIGVPSAVNYGVVAEENPLIEIKWKEAILSGGRDHMAKGTVANLSHFGSHASSSSSIGVFPAAPPRVAAPAPGHGLGQGS